MCIAPVCAHTVRVLPRCQLKRMAVRAVSKLYTFEQDVIGDCPEPAAQRMQHLCATILLECLACCFVRKSGPVVGCRDNGHVCGLAWPPKHGGGGGALGVYLLPLSRFVWGELWQWLSFCLHTSAPAARGAWVCLVCQEFVSCSLPRSTRT